MSASNSMSMADRATNEVQRETPDSATTCEDQDGAAGFDLWSAVGRSLEFQAAAPPMRAVARQEPLPLSWAQERLWVVQQSDPASVAYNLAFAWRLSGRLNVRALDQSIGAIVRRHEVFRTIFSCLSGEPVQIISNLEFAGLSLVDNREHGVADQNESISRWLAEESRRPFGLAHGPLLRASLLRLSDLEHVFLLSMHHIICDAASLDILFRELAEYYDEYDGSTAAPARALPIQYADFAVWERGWLCGPALGEQLAFWKARLGETLPILELPNDRPRQTQPNNRGAILHFDLPNELRASLTRLRREQGVTLFNIFLAAFKALLHRYTGESDIVVGSLAANRNRRELRDLIGFFANTIVLRTEVNGNMTFRDLLLRVCDTVLGAFANQDVPFQYLVQKLGLSGSGGGMAAPLFQVMFLFQSVPKRALELTGLCARTLTVDNGTAKFDLTLAVNETDDGISAWFEYRTERFGADTILQMAKHFQNILAAAALNPDQPVWALPLLSNQERRRILIEWNNTAPDYDHSACVHHLFENQAARTPDAIAVSFRNQRLTYRELDERANHLSAHLETLGVGRGQLVAILMNRSLEMMISLLAVLKAGAAYLPLDPSYPRNRLSFMFGDANVSALLTQSHTQFLPEPGALQVVLVDKVIGDTSAGRFRRPASKTTANSSDLMYVIYTSGSTGVPKGVEVSHRSVANLLASMRDCPGLSEADRLLALTTIAFDISVLELFLPLTCGAQVVIAPSELALSPQDLAAEIEREGITIMQATPTVWRQLVDSGWTGNRSLKALCGGEPLPPELAVQLLERCGELWNLYGPTETTVWSAIHRVTQVSGPVPIGRPIANTELYVLDSHLQPVPVGVEGELFIGGDGLARGYLNRPELTSERFIANPFGHGARLYRSGDRARYLPDGNLVCLGRSDHQVKIRGFRIELGEIASLLERHPSVQAAVVVAEHEREWDGKLLAYWTARPNLGATAAELRKFLEQRLPAYMVPAGYMQVPAFPLTPGGKVDRAALPKFNPNRDCVTEAPFEAPHGPIEILLTQIWQEVLNQKTVGAHDDFFELGGHSLAMTQVISRVNASLRLQLPAATFLQRPTIARLAKAISEAQSPAAATT